MSTSPLISIVIPTYNRQHSVQRAIQSAQKQTYSNIEIIVSDNASTDQTQEVVLSLAQDDQRIQYHRTPQNLGPVPNWKNAIQLAQGQYVKILFSDDYLDPQAIEQMIQIFLQYQHSLAFVLATAAIHLPNNQKITLAPAHLLDQPISQTQYFHSVTTHLSIVSPCLALFRKSDLLNAFVDKIPHFDPDMESYILNRGIGYDVILYWRIAIHYASIYAISTPLINLTVQNSDIEPCITVQSDKKRLTQGYQHALKYFFWSYFTYPMQHYNDLYELLFFPQSFETIKLRDLIRALILAKKYRSIGMKYSYPHILLAYLLSKKKHIL